MSGALYQPKVIARRHAKTARQPLLSSCALAAALGAAGHGAPARAQIAPTPNPSYVATHSVVGGSADVSHGTGVTPFTQITVRSSRAIIEWTPTNAPGTDGVIAFQSGGTAIFESGGSDYAVLNRILPTGNNAVSFNGITESVIGSLDGGPRGGTVWFYSPGGIILGSSARFDVGSLGLTTADILNSDFLDGNNSYSFAAGADSRAQVTINAGAQINALNEGSYVAIVSPRISQAGAIDVNGSAAYVAAEAADITINGGLFNIAVQTGSAVDAGGETTLTHTGTTTGAASTSGSDPQAIYMVAMPKNDAVTMLVSGTVGYDAAVSASVDNGTVVLSAGLNITSASNGLGGVDVTRSAGSAPSVAANFTIGSGTLTSRLAGYATHNASITVTGGSLLAESDVLLDASAIGSNGANGGNANGGTASITLVNATMETNRTTGTGGLQLLANGTGGVGLTGGNGRGGTASVSLDDSVLTVGTVNNPQTLRIEASGTGGNGTDGGAGGIGQGGAASLTIFDSAGPTTGALTVNAVSIEAQGVGGEFGYGSTSGGAGGEGIGGTASLALSAGTLSSPTIDIIASADGGDGNSAADGPNAGNGGAATGGTASLAVNGGTLAGDFSLLSVARGGRGGDAFETGFGASGTGGAGGVGQGGTASFVQGGGNVSGSFFALRATGSGGFGGSSVSAAGGAGGAGRGGSATLAVSNGSTTATGGVFLLADGSGGTGRDGSDGGDGIGGTASVLSGSGGLIDIADLSISAGGFGGSSFESGYGIPVGGDGGAGTGGAVTLGTSGGALALSFVSLLAGASGGDGGDGDIAGGNGGAATGGSVTLTAGDSPFDVRGIDTTVSIAAFGGQGGSGNFGSGAGGDGGNGGTANGGRFTLSASGGAGALTVDPAIFDPTPPNVEAPPRFDNSALGGSGGIGGSGTTGGRGGDGGNATGSTVEFATNLGTVTIDGLTSLGVTAVGGDGGGGGDGSNVGNSGGAGGNGSDGTGGTIRVNVAGGAVNLGTTEFFAHGNGGFAGSGGVGAGNPAAVPPISPTFASNGIDGRGRGGTVSIIVDDNDATGDAGSASFSDTSINVGGFIGDGFDDIGGRIEIYDNGVSPDGELAFLSLNAVSTGFAESSDQATGQVFDLFSAERRINILGNANITLGDAAYFRATGNGGLDVGGDFNLTTGFFAFVQHDFQPATPADTISATNVNIVTASDFRAFADGRINASNEIDINSTFGLIELNAANAGGNIDLNAPFDITGGALTAGSGVLARSTGGGIDFDSITTDQNLNLRSATTLGLGAASVGGFIDVESAGNVTRFDNIVAGGDIEVDAGYDLTQPDDSNVVLALGSSVAAGSVTSTGGEIDIEATGAVVGGALSAGHELSITSLTGSVALASATAGTLDVAPSADNNRSIGILAAGDVTIAGAATAALDIGLGSATGSVGAGSLTAGRSIVLLAGDQVNLGAVTATDLVYIASSSMLPQLGTSPADFDAANLLGVDPVATGGAVSITGPVDPVAVVIAGNGIALAETVTASDRITLISTADIDAADLVSGNTINAAADGGITLGSADAGGTITLDAGSTLTGTSIQAGQDLFAEAAGDISIQDSGSGVRYVVRGDQNIQIGTIASDAIFVQAGVARPGSAVIGSATSTGTSIGPVVEAEGSTLPGSGITVSARNDVSITSAAADASVRLASLTGNILSSAITAGQNVGISSGLPPSLIPSLIGGTVALGSVQAGGVLSIGDLGPAFGLPMGPTFGDVSITGAVNAGSVDIATTSSIAFASIASMSTVDLAAGTNISGGPIAAGGGIDFGAGNAIATGDIASDGLIAIGAGSDVQTGNLVSHAQANGARFVAIGIETEGEVSIGNAVADFGDIDIDVTGGITAGALSAGDSVRLLAGGPISTGALTGGTFAAGASSMEGYLGSVGAGALGNLTIASATALNDIGLAATGSLTAGALSAGRDIGLAVTGDISLASASAGREFFAGNASVIFDLGLADGLALEDLPTILATAPVATDGDLAVTGTVEAEAIVAAIGGNATVNSLSAFASIDLGVDGDLDAVSMTAGDEINVAVGGDAMIATVIAGMGPAAGGLFQVNALANSSAGGSPLATIDVVAGERITVSSSTDDLWSAGALPRFSDGNGLVGTRFATANDDSGQPIGTQIGANFGSLTLGGFSAPFGALVGTVEGQRILLGANGSFIAPASGTLQLSYWDSNAGDNSGSIAFTVMGRSALVNGSGFINVQAGGSASIGYAQAGGSVDISANTVALDTALSGGAINLLSNGAATSNALIATGDILVDAGSIQLVSAEAGGEITLSTAPAGNALLATPVPGSTISADTLLAGGDIRVDGLDDISIGSAEAGGLVRVVSANALNVGSAVSAGNMLLSGVDSLTIGSAVGGGDVEIVTDLRAGDTSLTTPRAISVGSAEAGDDLIVAAFGAVTAGSLKSNGTGQDGTRGLRNFYNDEPGSTVYVISEKGATIDSIEADNIARAINIAEMRNGVQISDGSGGITIGSIVAGGAVELFSPESAINVGTIEAGGAVGLRSDNAAVAVTENISAGGQVSALGTDIGLNALGDLSLADLIATTGVISVNSGGTLSISGSISAPTIQMASHDIAIGSEAEVGDQEVTQSLTLVNIGDTQTVIGGSDASGAWSLSNAEFGRLSGHEINLFGPALSEFSGPDVLVRQLDIIGSAGADSGGRRRNLTGSILSIVTDGSIDVDGALALTSAGVDDTIFLGAADRIRVLTPSGSITATDAQGGIGGQIFMAANEIFVGSPQAYQDIGALSTTDEIDERLGTNDGALRPEGYLQANSMQFAIVDALYIQNSGGPGLRSSDRAGFTVGTGGVGIFTESSSSRIIINGRQSNGSGGFVTGRDLIPLLTINGSHNPTGGFDLRSTANGCLIVSQSCRFDMQTPVLPVQDVIEEVVEVPENQENQDGTAVVQALNVPTIQFVDYTGLSFAPLIDEPVTGAGNDDFWIGDEEGPGEE